MLYEVITVSYPYEAMTAKQLELLRELVPNVARVGILLNPANPEHERVLPAIEAAARHTVITSYSIHYTKLYDRIAYFRGLALKHHCSPHAALVDPFHQVLRASRLPYQVNGASLHVDKSRSP